LAAFRPAPASRQKPAAGRRQRRDQDPLAVAARQRDFDGSARAAVAATPRHARRPARTHRSRDQHRTVSSHNLGDDCRFGGGRDLESLLWDIGKRIDAPEFRFFIIALSVQRETGGNLAETLGNLGDVLRRRRTMRAKARAMASEARASTMILGSLPGLVTVILMMTSPSYIMPLFTDVRGLVLVGIALGMLAFGIFIMVRM